VRVGGALFSGGSGDVCTSSKSLWRKSYSSGWRASSRLHDAVRQLSAAGVYWFQTYTHLQRARCTSSAWTAHHRHSPQVSFAYSWIHVVVTTLACNHRNVLMQGRSHCVSECALCVCNRCNEVQIWTNIVTSGSYIFTMLQWCRRQCWRNLLHTQRLLQN